MVHNKRTKNLSLIAINCLESEHITSWRECKLKVKKIVHSTKTTVNWVNSLVYRHINRGQNQKQKKYYLNAIKKLKMIMGLKKNKKV